MSYLTIPQELADRPRATPGSTPARPTGPRLVQLLGSRTTVRISGAFPVGCTATWDITVTAIALTRPPNHRRSCRNAGLSHLAGLALVPAVECIVRPKQDVPHGSDAAAAREAPLPRSLPTQSLELRHHNAKDAFRTLASGSRTSWPPTADTDLGAYPAPPPSPGPGSGPQCPERWSLTVSVGPSYIRTAQARSRAARPPPKINPVPRSGSQDGAWASE